jgi:hypothetical protein
MLHPVAAGKDHKRSLDDDKTKIEFWLQHFPAVMFRR